MKLIKVKTSELTEAALDYAVAVAQGRKEIKVYAPSRPGDRGWIEVRFNPEPKAATARFDPSINWGFGGPIIEREKIAISAHFTRDNWWLAEKGLGGQPHCFGSTPLIAAMRCFVCLRLGDEVEVPESLVKH